MEVDSQTEMTQSLPEHAELLSLSLQGGVGSREVSLEGLSQA